MKAGEEDFNLLAVFEAIFDTRSVSRASERLGISQPSVSNALARLRKTFNDPLFVRVRNEMQPTSRALEIASPVQRALSLVRSEIFLRREFDPLQARNTFTICMTDLAEAAYLPAVLDAFRPAAPMARLRTVSPFVERVEEGLECGSVDVAVGYFPDLTSAGILQQRLLRSTGFVCIADENNPHLRRGKLSAKAFCEAPHVAVHIEGRSSEVIEREMENQSVKRRVLLTVPHFFGLLSIIPKSDLLAIIPVDLSPVFAGRPEIRIHPLPFKSPSVSVSQVWHRRYDKNAANRWIRGVLRQALQRN